MIVSEEKCQGKECEWVCRLFGCSFQKENGKNSGLRPNFWKKWRLERVRLTFESSQCCPRCKGNLGKAMGREVMKMNILEKLEDGGIAKIKGFSERHIQPKLCKLIAISMLPVVTQVSVNAQITDFLMGFLMGLPSGNRRYFFRRSPAGRRSPPMSWEFTQFPSNLFYMDQMPNVHSAMDQNRVHQKERRRVVFQTQSDLVRGRLWKVPGDTHRVEAGSRKNKFPSPQTRIPTKLLFLSSHSQPSSPPCARKKCMTANTYHAL